MSSDGLAPTYLDKRPVCRDCWCPDDTVHTPDSNAVHDLAWCSRCGACCRPPKNQTTDVSVSARDSHPMAVVHTHYEEEDL